MKINEATNLNFFQNELRGFIYKRIKDKSVTDDIIQDVFLKVRSKIDQLQENEKITGWIYQITKNTIIDHFRKTPKTVSALDLQWDSDVQNFNECVSGYLKELIPTLPEKYRDAIQLIEIENLSQLELASRLGISYPGAKSRVQRARQMLREKLHQELFIKTDPYGNILVCMDRKRGCNTSS